MRKLFNFMLIAAAAMPCAAAPLSVHVVDGNGRPVSDAVVVVHAIGRSSPAPRPGGNVVIEQRNLQFHPFVSLVPVGATVTFPNFDTTRHHVYSFSAAKRFEFKLFARDQSRSVTLDRPGTIAVGCNIHDQMSAYVFVTDTALAARTDGSGNVTFRDAPSGAVTVRVWHPYLRAPDGAVSRQLALGNAAHAESFAVKLRSPPMHDMGSY